MVNVDEIIYQFWTDDNPLPANRARALSTSKANFNVTCQLLKKKDIEEKILPEFPLHPGYQYLSSVHKSDYLRSYFMYHFGGGYADIKYFNKKNNWKECFELINSTPEIDIVGQKESPGGSGIVYLNYPENIGTLITNAWFICRPYSYFTKLWYDRVQQKMDQRYEILKRYPAIDPFGAKNYPLRWGELQSEIFHSICHEVWWYDNKKINNSLNPGVVWTNYR